MNLDTLKNSVLTGTDEAKSNFVSTLKARCVKSTDETVMVNGVEEKLFYNSENGTYFDRYMTIYRKCPCCGNIKPVSDFVTCPILREQRYCHEGERVKRKEEIVCRDCVEEGNFVVPCKDKANTNAPIADNGFYLYRNPDESVKPDYKTVEFEYRDENGNIVHGFTYRECFDFHSILKWNYETNEFDKLTYGFYDYEDAIRVNYPGTDGDTHFAYLTREDVEAHPETWKKCYRCNEWYHCSMIVESRMCKKCDADLQIPPYHSWPGKTVFMASDSEIVDGNTLFFGLEIPVYIFVSDVREHLLDPVADIFHLERASEHVINSDFYIVSQPMTLAYLKENIGRIKDVLDSLSDKGVSKGYFSGFVINTPFAAYKDKESLRRACGIVCRLNDITRARDEFYRVRDEFYDWPGDADHYYGIGSIPSTKQLDELIKLEDSYCAAKFIDYSKVTIPTVRYRMFKETLYADKIMAYVEHVNNIVKIANSKKPAVYLRDLFGGEYLPKFAKSMPCSEDKPMLCFGVKDRIDKATEALKAFARSGQPIEAIDDAINRLIDSLSASDESKSNE